MKLKNVVENKETSSITIQGYGQISIDKAKSMVKRKLAQALSELDSESENSFNNIYSTLYGDGVLQQLVKELMKSSKD